MNWLRAGANSVVLTLHIQPGAKKTEITGPHGDALKLRLAAPPVDGKANEALIDFLSRTLEIPKTAVALVSGHTARCKRVAIAGMTAARVEECLFPAVKAG